MQKLLIAIAFVVMSTSAPVLAQEAPMMTQDAPAEAQAKPAHVSMFRAAMSEVAILRYRSALKLKAEQEKYWPAVANALRAMAREPQVTEATVRRYAPAVSPLLATLDDNQRQVVMSIAQKTGLTQYASMF